MIGLGSRRFQAAGTDIPPNLPTKGAGCRWELSANKESALLGIDLLYLGPGVAPESLWAIGLVAPLLWIINFIVIIREERYREQNSAKPTAPTGGGFEPKAADTGAQSQAAQLINDCPVCPIFTETIARE